MNKQADMAQFHGGILPLVEKWDKPYINTYQEVTGTDLSFEKKLVLAQCLETTDLTLKGALREATLTPDVSGFANFALELVTAITPNLVTNEVATVQPMPNRVGEVRYIKYLYGSNKGKVRAGDEYNSALNFTGGNFDYSSEDIDPEVVGNAGSTAYEGNLNYLPIRPGTAEFHIGNIVIKDNGQGQLVSTPSNALTGTDNTFNYASGHFKFTLAAAAAEDVVAKYSYNLEDMPGQIPQVDIKLELLPILARPRKLRTLITFDAMFNANRDHGLNLNANLAAQIGAEVRHEIDGEVLNDILLQANAQGGTVPTWSKTPTNAVSVRDHYESFWNKVIEMSNMIFSATKRASATFIVGGMETANIIEAFPDFRPSGAAGRVGPHVAGTIRGLTFIKNPYYAPGDFVVGYKGSNFTEAGYAYLPHMPIMASQLIMLDDFVARRGYATSYAKRMLNNKLFCRGKITN